MVKNGGKTNPVTKMTSSGPRVRRLTRRQKRAKAKSEARSSNAPIGSFRLTWRSFNVVGNYWKPLLGIMIVYLVLNIIFANGLSNIGSVVSDIKFELEIANSENLSPLGSAINGFGNLVASAGTSGSSTGSVLQSVLIVLQSLVIIWVLRHLLAGKKIKLKQAYYESMAPLVPFLLVILVIFLQLLPLSFGVPIIGAILSAIFVGGGSIVTIIYVVFAGLLAGWSLYMLSSSIMALYIVTLPGMHPRRALKSAKNLVIFRRFSIMRRLLFLPVFIILVMAAVIVPLILTVTFLVMPVFLLLSVFSLLFSHVYLYSLYRELIK